MPESTFTNFTSAQAATYASERGDSYPPALYDAILNYYHQSKPKSKTPLQTHDEGGSKGNGDVLLDIGTGPGTALYDLLPWFERGIGIDPGREMIEAARRDVRFGSVGGKARFEVCGAEGCGEIDGVGGVVGLGVAGMAAHWFDMPAFYSSVAKALRPGATLAMWTCSSLYAHPSDPRHKEIQAILSHLEDNLLAPYETHGNRLSRDAYKNLPLPWTLETPNTCFDESSFERLDWDLHGVPSAPAGPGGVPGPFLLGDEESVEKVGKGVNASSMILRWREANRESVEKGEVKDCVEQTVEGLREVLADRPGSKFVVAPSCTLLLLRRV